MIVQEISELSDEVRTFIAHEFGRMLREADFHDAFPGHLSALSRQRDALVMKRINAIAALG